MNSVYSLQTSNVILWCLYELSRNPEAQDKIFGEFKQSGCPNNSLKFQDLKELTYLKAVVKETLRYMIKLMVTNWSFALLVSRLLYRNFRRANAKKR